MSVHKPDSSHIFSWSLSLRQSFQGKKKKEKKKIKRTWDCLFICPDSYFALPWFYLYSKHDKYHLFVCLEQTATFKKLMAAFLEEGRWSRGTSVASCSLKMPIFKALFGMWHIIIDRLDKHSGFMGCMSGFLPYISISPSTSSVSLN